MQVAIREALVLPNCEGLCIPWMLAEKDDWVPRKAAPFMWIKQEPATTRDGNSSQSVEEKFIPEAKRGPLNSSLADRQKKTDKAGHLIQENESTDQQSSSSAPVHHLTSTEYSSHELRTPLLETDELDETIQRDTDEKSENGSSSQSITLTGQRNDNAEDDDSRPKRIGTKARMLVFGKKMGEKLEEKRKHIEEKGRHIVERIKDHRQNSVRISD